MENFNHQSKGAKTAVIRDNYNKNQSGKFPDGPLASGTLLEKRYEIITLIKSGGMGAVYKALDLKFNTFIAVKELIPLFGTPNEIALQTEWFKREGRILNKLDHSNLPKVSDYFITNGRYYLVMTFIEGEDLETKLSKEGYRGFSEDKVTDWALQVLNVLDYLHNQSPPVIYRDIKPANIMLTKSGKVMLIDFGIARAVQQESQTKKTSIGTSGYAPPEQYRGKAVPSSDLYALGATMHNLLTGIEPIPFKFESLRKIKPDTSKKLENIINIALKDNVSERFLSAREMKEAFKDKPSKADDLFEKGEEFFDRGDYSRAVKCYDEVIKIDPSYYKALNAKGLVLTQKDKLDEGIYYFNKALSINPLFYDGLINKGTALQQLNKTREALRCFDEALKIAPDAVIAWINKGTVLLNLERPEEALKCFNKVLDLDPHHYAGWGSKGLALGAIGKYEEALRCYNKAIELNPDAVLYWINKGNLLSHLNRHSEAMSCIDRAVMLEPGNPYCLEARQYIMDRRKGYR